MKKTLLIYFILIISSFSFAAKIDSLNQKLNETHSNILKAKILREICQHYYTISNDSVVKYSKIITDFTSNDTTTMLCKAKSYEDLAYVANQNKKFEDEEKYYLKAIELFLKLEKKSDLIKNYGNLANLFLHTARYDEALKSYRKSYEIAEILNDSTSIIISNINIGNVFKVQGKYSEAIQCYMLALKNSEKIKNEKYQAISLNSIGVVHWGNKSYEKAIQYIEKSLDLRNKLKDKKGASVCYLNIGIIYDEQGKFDDAIINYQKSLKLKREVDDKSGISKCYNNLGLSLKNKKNYSQAIEYYLKSLEIKREYSDKEGMSLVLGNISNLYNTIADSSNISASEKRENYHKAIEFGLESFQIANEIKSNQSLLFAANAIMYSYTKLENFEKAIEFAYKVIAYKDSLFSDEKTKVITEMDVKYQSEKHILEITNLEKQSLLDKKTIEIQDALSKKQQILIFSFIFGFIIILTFSTVLYRLFIQKKKANTLLAQQNQEILQQKEEIIAQRDEISKHRDLVVAQKEEIEDSINYAKRIQEAVLPISEASRAMLENHFILFRPKDIVSGDFYWIAKIQNRTIIAVADCTGHGVPGAFMSMLRISFLNEIVRNQEIVKANQILNKLREEIINALQQKGEFGEQKDGMDMSLIIINNSQLAIKNFIQAQWAGANNPLYIVKSEKLKVKNEDNTKVDELSTFNFQLDEVKPDKMPIAIYDRMNDFTNHEFELQKNDCIYLLSDGYADQFGGRNHKKFLSRNLKQLLITNCQLPMPEQKIILETTLLNWIGDGEQIDDITIVGIKI